MHVLLVDQQSRGGLDVLDPCDAQWNLEEDEEVKEEVPWSCPFSCPCPFFLRGQEFAVERKDSKRFRGYRGHLISSPLRSSCVGRVGSFPEVVIGQWSTYALFLSHHRLLFYGVVVASGCRPTPS